MKRLALFILCIQFGWVSSCVFDKAEVVPGKIYQEMIKDESGCFAACYENNKCIALAYRKISGGCAFFTTENSNQTCHPGDVCYTLQRDEEDSMCARYVNV
ncbi:unnamed protein product [Cylicocyclus nassatus]|uniref:Apple domain-containing protein n=1 Tax=Cylicocyclus nassatus TaxID=53992 RepID=A0AA36GXC0_CYLNA|nr:unnamed protein product [Cylicocyclus nassatus]